MTVPIAELAALLMSHGCSADLVRSVIDLTQQHAIETVSLCNARSADVGGLSADVGGSSVDSTAERRKEYDRKRQAEIRRLRRAEKTGDILTSLSSSLLTEETLKKERKKESSGIRARDASAVPDDYPENYGDLFWQAYPRKEEKISTMKKLASLRKSGIVPFADLMAGVQRYCSVPREPQFIKQPTVWLNKGCWADETQTGATNGQRSGNTRASGHDAILAAFTRKAREIVGDGAMAGADGEDEFSWGNGTEPRPANGIGGSPSIFAPADERRASGSRSVLEGEIIPPDEPASGIPGSRH